MQLLIVHEAGPCGYGLARQLCARGYRCEVIAPTMIPRKPGDRIKTDRRDALALAHFARAGDLTPVLIPEEPDEAIRDLSRAREDAVRAGLKARQQLKAMLLRHGQRYTGKKSWNAAHERWLAALGFSHPAQNIAFLEYHAMREHDEGNPRKFYGGIQGMIPDARQRQPRDVPMQCGNQSANIRVIHRRHKLRASHSPSRVTP
jgi:transposase